MVMQQQAQLQKLTPQPPTLLYGDEADSPTSPAQDFKFQPSPAAANDMLLPNTLALPNIAVEGSFPEVIKSEWDLSVVPSVVKAKRTDPQRTQPVDEHGYDDSHTQTARNPSQTLGNPSGLPGSLRFQRTARHPLRPEKREKRPAAAY